MALFGKNREKENAPEEDFSEYVDSLLDAEEQVSTREQALRPNYSIDQAIALMRKMPKDNQDLVISVIRDTLQSADIDVSAIINDAEHKSSGLQQNVTDLKDRISALREQIKDMEAQIQGAEKDLSETCKVRELLQASIVKKATNINPPKIAAAQQEPSARQEPSAQQEPSAKQEPSAHKESPAIAISAQAKDKLASAG